MSAALVESRVQPTNECAPTSSGWLRGGLAEAEILTDYPELTPVVVIVALQFANLPDS